MKKTFSIFLSILICLASVFCFTSCSFTDKLLDDTKLELENKSLKEENQTLKETNKTLETTLDFYSKFPGGVVDEDATLTNVHIELTKVGAIGITVTNGATLTIEDSYIDGGEGGDNQAIRVEEGGALIIKDGIFTVGKDANGNGNSVIENRGGSITIEGGLFYTDYAYNGFYYVLNQLNSNPGTIVVRGGDFVNYDPSKGDDNLGGNFLPKGYKIEAEILNETTTIYHVVEDEVTVNISFYNEDIKLYEEEVVKGSTFNLYQHSELSNLSKEGFEFVGWSLTKNGEVVEFEAGVFTAEEDVAYYAIFKEVASAEEPKE